MDLSAVARDQQGLVLSSQLGVAPARAAARRHLERLQPRVYIATTQPVGPVELLAAVRESVQGEYGFLADTALWLYELGDPPEVVRVGVPHTTRFRGLAPVVVRRVCPEVLRGRRPLGRGWAVAPEVALIQASAGRPEPPVLASVELALRERYTTMPRIRSRLRRGVAGSAAVRAALDALAGTSLDAAVRRLRKALEARGVDGLQTELHFRNAAGSSAYGDLVDVRGRTVVEVDGYLSHIERARFRADRRRDRWLVAQHGYVTLRVDAAETVDDLDAVAAELAEVILRRRSGTAVAG